MKKAVLFIEKSRKDDTLLTVGFNLRMVAGNHANAVETHCNASLQDNAQRYCINAVETDNYPSLQDNDQRNAKDCLRRARKLGSRLRRNDGLCLGVNANFMNFINFTNFTTREFQTF